MLISSRSIDDDSCRCSKYFSATGYLNAAWVEITRNLQQREREGGIFRFLDLVFLSLFARSPSLIDSQLANVVWFRDSGHNTGIYLSQVSGGVVSNIFVIMLGQGGGPTVTEATTGYVSMFWSFRSAVPIVDREINNGARLEWRFSPSVYLQTRGGPPHRRRSHSRNDLDRF